MDRNSNSALVEKIILIPPFQELNSPFTKIYSVIDQWAFVKSRSKRTVSFKRKSRIQIQYLCRCAALYFLLCGYFFPIYDRIKNKITLHLYELIQFYRLHTIPIKIISVSFFVK